MPVVSDYRPTLTNARLPRVKHKRLHPLHILLKTIQHRLTKALLHIGGLAGFRVEYFGYGYGVGAGKGGCSFAAVVQGVDYQVVGLHFVVYAGMVKSQAAVF